MDRVGVLLIFRLRHGVEQIYYGRLVQIHLPPIFGIPCPLQKATTVYRQSSAKTNYLILLPCTYHTCVEQSLLPAFKFPQCDVKNLKLSQNNRICAVTGHCCHDPFRPYFLAKTSLILWTFRPQIWTFRPKYIGYYLSVNKCH